MEIDLRMNYWFDREAAMNAVRKAMVPRLKKCGYMVEAEAKRILSKSGRVKETPAEKKARKKSGAAAPAGIPSAPGAPPHLQTGNLRASIQSAATSEDTVVVGPTTTAWYGIVHEFGGRHHPKRPFMRPALMACVDKFPAEFGNLDFGGA